MVVFCRIRLCSLLNAQLNATGCAVPRMIVAILEQFQNADGSVRVPAALQKLMGVEKISRKV